MTLSIAQITDLHLLVDPQAALRGCVTTPRAAAVFANLKQRSPDLLLLSGDLSEDGSPASYERLRDWVEELGCPAIAIAGNHDQPERLTEICGDRLLWVSLSIPSKAGESLHWIPTNPNG
nr:unnamed protein product [Synechococcus elongatus PCC 6301]